MSGIFSKAKNLFKQKKFGELREKGSGYLRYMGLRAWFRLSGKHIHPVLRMTNKHWVMYTYLKAKYARFLRNYNYKHNETHEYSNKVWWCWLQGEKNAPDISKACLASIRRTLPGKEIIVITEKNMTDYAEMPGYIMEKYRCGKITRTHFSDLLRLQVLVAHGGIWVDSTVYLSSPPDYAFGRPLFVLQTREDKDPATAAQSWFIAAEKGEPILTLARDLLFEYWRTHNRLIHYFLIYFFLKIASERYPEEWNEIPFFPDAATYILERELFRPYSKERISQIFAMSDIHKLTYKFDQIEGNAHEKDTIYGKIIVPPPSLYRTNSVRLFPLARHRALSLTPTECRAGGAA